MRANLRPDAVFQRSYDFAARRVVLRIGAEYQRNVQLQADWVALNLHIAFLHDVEQGDLNFARQVRQFIDGEDAAIGAGQQAIVHGQLVGEILPSACGLDRIEIADQVSHGNVGRRQLFHVAVLAFEPRDRRGIAR